MEVSGAAATSALAALVAAPGGTGPDAEFACTVTPPLRGAEAIVLVLQTTLGTSEVFLRYDGCGNGLDDGIATRMLTRDAVAPFVSGSNVIADYTPALAGILDSPDAPATSGGDDS